MVLPTTGGVLFRMMIQSVGADPCVGPVYRKAETSPAPTAPASKVAPRDA